MLQTHEKALLHAAAGLNISWTQIIDWIVQYGLPVVSQVLAALFSGNLSGLTFNEILTWILAALAAVASGGQVPPLPTPVPTPAP